MHGTRLYEAERSRRLLDFEYISDILEKSREKDTDYYANWTQVSSIAYGKKPQATHKKKKITERKSRF